jgi:hypothetical protein
MDDREDSTNRVQGKKENKCKMFFWKRSLLRRRRRSPSVEGQAVCEMHWGPPSKTGTDAIGMTLIVRGSCDISHLQNKALGKVDVKGFSRVDPDHQHISGSKSKFCTDIAFVLVGCTLR